MTKTLFLVRHGKAESRNTEKNDFERHLKPKGVRRTQKVIDAFMQNNLPVDRIISSTAFRAMETAEMFALALGMHPSDITAHKDLYFNMNTEQLTGYLKKIPDTIRSVMIFGHNPAIEQYAEDLCDDFCGFVPTTGLVALHFMTKTWTHLPLHSGKLLFFYYPKAL